MNTTVLNSLRRLLGPQFEEISGSRITGEIPVTTRALNRVLAEELARREAPVSAVLLEAYPQDTMVAHVTLRGPRFLPQITVRLNIERQPEWPRDPVLWLRWSLPKLGPLALVATPLASHFAKLPPGIRLDGERLAVDLGALLAAQGFADLLTHVRGLSIHTAHDRVIVTFDASV